MVAKLRPAATVIPIREAAVGTAPKLLLLRRAKTLSFAPECWVFPGGALEQGDYLNGRSDIIAASFNAASREAREESGLVLPPEQLLCYSHWITPAVEPKRFSTWMCLARLQEDQPVQVDNYEITAHQWLTAAEAIERYEAGQLKLMPPTYLSLLEFRELHTVERLLARIDSRKPPCYRPKIVGRGNQPGYHQGLHILYEEDVAYETENLDAEGRYHRITVTDRGYKYINSSSSRDNAFLID